MTEVTLGRSPVSATGTVTIPSAKEMIASATAEFQARSSQDRLDELKA
jgi:hypothetical protein